MSLFHEDNAWNDHDQISLCSAVAGTVRTTFDPSKLTETEVLGDVNVSSIRSVWRGYPLNIDQYWEVFLRLVTCQRQLDFKNVCSNQL